MAGRWISKQIGEWVDGWIAGFIGELMNGWVALENGNTILSLIAQHLKVVTILESPILRCLAQD